MTRQRRSDAASVARKPPWARIRISSRSIVAMLWQEGCGQGERGDEDRQRDADPEEQIPCGQLCLCEPRGCIISAGGVGNEH